MKKHLMFMLALALLVILPVSAFAEIKLTVAEVHPEDYPTTMGLKKFAELVKERSNGEIVIDVKFGGVLGKDEKAVVEQVQIGALDIARISMSPVMEFVPSFEAFGLPYVWKDQANMWKVLKSETGLRLLKEMENFKFYGLCYYESGDRSFYNSKREIKTVADLAGLKLRVQPSELMIDMVKALGANATPMAFGEVYEGISKGVVDGAENNWPSYESTKHFEVAPYYTLDMHTRVPELLVASKITLDKKLKPEQIDMLKQAALDTQDYVIEKWNERVEASKKIVLESGKVTVTELTPEARDGFVQAVQPLLEKYGAKHKAILDEMKAIQQ